MLADRECPAVCTLRAVTAYISAAERMGWNLTAGHLFPVVTAEGGRGSLLLPAARMTTALQGHLRAAGLPSHFTMHSFRVGGSLSQSLDGTAVDKIMKIGGWKTESVAKYYTGPPLAEKCTEARGNAARATLALASCPGQHMAAYLLSCPQILAVRPKGKGRLRWRRELCLDSVCIIPHNLQEVRPPKRACSSKARCTLVRYYL